MWGRRLVRIGILALCAGLFGCGTTGKFSYPPDAASMFRSGEAKAKDKTVLVLPFKDVRTGENSEMGMVFYILPVSPFGWVAYDHPEDAVSFVTIEGYDASPFVDFARAAATSLRRSNLFKDATFMLLGADKSQADFTLGGQIREMRYEGKICSYGISIFGPILWGLGAPAGVSTNALAFDLELRNRKGDVVWTHSFRRSVTFSQGAYYREGEDCKPFSELLQAGMNAALADLAAHMDAHPEQFR